VDRGGATLTGLRAHQRIPRGAAAAPGIPHRADGLVHPAAVPGRRCRQPGRARRRGLGNLFGALDALRIPIEYLAGLFTAGNVAPVEAVLHRLAAMRSYMRDVNLGRETQPHIPAAVGMTEEQIYDMYRLLAIAKYEERYVIPSAYAPSAGSVEEPGCCCCLRRRPGTSRAVR
jgi:nitrate reductase beta subunit